MHGLMNIEVTFSKMLNNFLKPCVLKWKKVSKDRLYKYHPSKIEFMQIEKQLNEYVWQKEIDEINLKWAKPSSRIFSIALEEAS